MMSTASRFFCVASMFRFYSLFFPSWIRLRFYLSLAIRALSPFALSPAKCQLSSISYPQLFFVSLLPTRNLSNTIWLSHRCGIHTLRCTLTHPNPNPHCLEANGGSGSAVKQKNIVRRCFKRQAQRFLRRKQK
ncbi:hypothetical protein E2C01_038828 [Portunus trituberculatus]|uniref:Uncharacterized protein n=1 Tax=Portunus trituberculatus TaxID=210409 RepID=A0A5B7FF67_PORTR|nr:hypothetical protein [Portunus trituberculatus]